MAFVVVFAFVSPCDRNCAANVPLTCLRDQHFSPAQNHRHVLFALSRHDSNSNDYWNDWDDWVGRQHQIAIDTIADCRPEYDLVATVDANANDSARRIPDLSLILIYLWPSLVARDDAD